MLEVFDGIFTGDHNENLKNTEHIATSRHWRVERVSSDSKLFQHYYDYQYYD